MQKRMPATGVKLNSETLVFKYVDSIVASCPMGLFKEVIDAFIGSVMPSMDHLNSEFHPVVNA